MCTAEFIVDAKAVVKYTPDPKLLRSSSAEELRPCGMAGLKTWHGSFVYIRSWDYFRGQFVGPGIPS